jgi:hypothetical protein
LCFARPGVRELPDSEADDLEQHLAGCSECDTLARSERHLDDNLGRAMRAVPVPDGLRGRLLKNLESERGQQRWRRLAWVFRAAAAAILLVGGVALALTFLPDRRARLNLEDVEVFRDNLYLITASSDREKVEEWFNERYGLTTLAPDWFNYGLLAHYDLADCQGKRVPMLLFAQGNDRVRVYILSDKQFDLQALPTGRKTESGAVTAVVWAHPQNPHFAYLVVYTGDSLERFLTGPQPHST